MVRQGSQIPHLSKTDLQKFFKRLRIILYRANLPSKISHYSVGEYGDRGGRPHYHSIIFGMLPNEAQQVEQAWDLGRVHIGSVTPASINYVSQYLDKKVLGPKQAFLGREPEFQLASNGLGKSWVHENIAELLYEASLTFQGKKYPMPRYYINELRKTFPDAADGMSDRIFWNSQKSEIEQILDACPQFGGRSYAQLSPTEREQLSAALYDSAHALSAHKEAEIKIRNRGKEL